MRLLKRVTDAVTGVSSLILEEHQGSIPPYTILSHCWGPSNDELSYLDLTTLSPTLQTKPGYQKIWNCMRKAEEDGFDYLWVDTCCIDKSSSAELSEGINSMFAWYKDAAVCYAYLDDVRSDLGGQSKPSSEFRRSRWFTRGWTLQELIAPSTVVFLDWDWVEFGTRATLATTVAEITGIEVSVLLKRNTSYMSIAKRMSWAARRETTRVEDRAYSLLGLFGVSMPAIYGEGERAFLRLQHEILKVSKDHSLFAWHDFQRPGFGPTADGILASSPATFADSNGFAPASSDKFIQQFRIKKYNPEQLMTNVGFRIELPLLKVDSKEMFTKLTNGRYPIPQINVWSWGIYFASIACVQGGQYGALPCMMLKRSREQYNQYDRLAWYRHSTFLVDMDDEIREKVIYQQIYIAGMDENLSGFNSGDPPFLKQRFILDTSGLGAFQILHTAPVELWEQNHFVTGLSKLESWWADGNAAIIFRCSKTGETAFAVFGTYMNSVWCDLGNADGLIVHGTEVTAYAENVLRAYDLKSKASLSSRQQLNLDRVAFYLERTRTRILMTIRRRNSDSEREIIYNVKVVVSSECERLI